MRPRQFRRGSGAGRGPCCIEGATFNEAAAISPRKWVQSRDGREKLPPSMRPRQFRRGSCLAATRCTAASIGCRCERFAERQIKAVASASATWLTMSNSALLSKRFYRLRALPGICAPPKRSRGGGESRSPHYITTAVRFTVSKLLPRPELNSSRLSSASNGMFFKVARPAPVTFVFPR